MGEPDKRIPGLRIPRRAEARKDHEQIGNVGRHHAALGIALFLPLDIRPSGHGLRIERPAVVTVAAQNDRALRQILQRNAPDLEKTFVMRLGQRPAFRECQTVAEHHIALAGQKTVARDLLDQFRSVPASLSTVKGRTAELPDDKRHDKDAEDSDGIQHNYRFLRCKGSSRPNDRRRFRRS